jgi:hypothetical protein
MRQTQLAQGVAAVPAHQLHKLIAVDGDVVKMHLVKCPASVVKRDKSLTETPQAMQSPAEYPAARSCAVLAPHSLMMFPALHPQRRSCSSE